MAVNPTVVIGDVIPGPAFDASEVIDLSFAQQEEEWETVYDRVDGVDELIGDHPHLQKFKTIRTPTMTSNTIYYQTGGGGPESGYFVHYQTKITRTDKTVKRTPQVEYYSVERSWGTPFTATKLSGGFVFEVCNDGTERCRFVEVPKESDEEEETCVKCDETKTESWFYNTTPVKNAPVCQECLEAQ